MLLGDTNKLNMKIKICTWSHRRTNHRRVSSWILTSLREPLLCRGSMCQNKQYSLTNQNIRFQWFGNQYGSLSRVKLHTHSAATSWGRPPGCLGGQRRLQPRFSAQPTCKQPFFHFLCFSYQSTDRTAYFHFVWTILREVVTQWWNDETITWI